MRYLWPGPELEDLEQLHRYKSGALVFWGYRVFQNRLHCYPTLDRSGLEFSAWLRSGELVTPTGFASMIGGIFPIAIDLPPVGPSFITRVCEFDFDNHGFQFGQARGAWRPQIAQALGALIMAPGRQKSSVTPLW
jgi:hypothetical protein